MSRLLIERHEMLLEMGLTPACTLFVGQAGENDAEWGWVPPQNREAIADAPEAVLVRLASGDALGLPPAWGFWRNLALEYINQLCRTHGADSESGFVVPPPREYLKSLAASIPPMPGGEYASVHGLAGIWNALGEQIADEIATEKGGLTEWLRERNPKWHVVGKVCFHLAENKEDEEYPFAFLATYAIGVSSRGKVQHAPLANALKQYAGEKNKKALLKLLEPIYEASKRCAVAKALVDSGEVYHPQVWTADEAYAFLKEIPAFEESGLAVRVPDWWKKRPRPVASVSIGKNRSGGLGADALLSFDVGVSLDGETLSPGEVQSILSGSDGLVLVKGKWAEVDKTRLAEALEHWRKMAREVGDDGLSLQKAMRLLAGGGSTGGDALLDENAVVRDWSRVAASGWFQKTLERLRSPDAHLEGRFTCPGLNAELRPYQEVGVQWLSFLGELGLGACLADDMGLGKTLQVIALLLRDAAEGEKAKRKRKPALIILPASLLGNWRSELQRFAPSVKAAFLHPAFSTQKELKAYADSSVRELEKFDCVLTSYAMASRYAWLSKPRWRFVILDEAQAIKNPRARQTKRVKDFRADVRIALTGTPVENRLGDLWSLFDFINPGLLGGAKTFATFVNRLADRDGNDRYRPLRMLTGPYILRRLKTDPAISSTLPAKTEVKAYCGLSKRQAVLYKESVDELAHLLRGNNEGLKRAGLILTYIMRFKQICNHPDQWLGQDRFDPKESGKILRLEEIVGEIASRRERCLVFTQFREMTGPLADCLTDVFGRPGLILHGETPVKQRKGIVDAFQVDNGPPFLVLSLKAGGVGLNLTAASQVIHFDRWWNPAVENQATDRAFRIGQMKNVMVHKFVTRGTIEERIDKLIEDKIELSQDVLEGGAVKALTDMDNEELLRFVSLDIKSAEAE